MLIIENQQHYDETVAFAREVGLYEGENNHTLANRLNYLRDYGGKDADGADRMRVRLLRDPAPHSFYFLIDQRNDEGEWKPLFHGGLLFHGPHDGGGSGAAPTFAVTLEPGRRLVHSHLTRSATPFASSSAATSPGLRR